MNRNPAESSKAYTVLVDSVTPQVYEAFLNEGWRRSGRALYRPDNWVSCCPAITIRLQAEKFQPTRSQRKLRRQAESIFSKAKAADASGDNSNPHVFDRNTVLAHALKDLQRSGFIDELRDRTATALQNKLGDSVSLPDIALKVQLQRRSDDPRLLTISTAACAAIAGRSKGAFDRNLLANGVVEELVRSLLGQAPFGDTKEDSKPQEARSTVSAETSPTMGSVAHKKRRSDNFRVEIQSIEAHERSGQILVHVRHESALDDASTAETYTKHESDLSNESSEQLDRGSCQRKSKLAAWWHRQHPNEGLPSNQSFDLVITSLPAHESALIPEVHRLYLRYQHNVHDDADPFDAAKSSDVSGDSSYGWAEKSPPGWLELAKTMLHEEYKEMPHFSRIVESYGQFYSFLIDNPFVTGGSAGTVDGLTLGTFHQLYRVQGSLVAVGVVDVLPQGLSSVYLFYDPSFSHDVLPLGKYATLREIDWTLQNTLPYYYLGYYIDSCPKMRYKADYHPSELLCPATKRWVDADEAKALIAEKSSTQNCCPLYGGADAETSGDETQVTPSDIRLEVGMGHPATVDMLLARGQTLVRPILEEFISEAGPRIAPLCTISFV